MSAREGVEKNMYQKENSSWVKHADFTICDMLCLQLAFVLAYWIRNGIGQPYETELYRNVAVVMFLIQLMVTFAAIFLVPAIKIKSPGPAFSHRSAWERTVVRSRSINSAPCIWMQKNAKKN